ncbi:MAG: tRNA (adenosine(37)-N6)-threonylcarbamoyltransferase complex ATPase subunit type 1 TsaE, partial [Gammaproteobacteria bacterium]|nr:tRNA (adenosine(37)-N6)-threonylcarbamoyltransferase complex ATPase subunit type 1 TsaE [Gammaproteobacteria bacterium]
AAEGYNRDAIVYLQGGLGAGKTTLVRGILRAMGFVGPVKSPTYTLLEPYEELLVFHFDLYRIADSRELDFIGIDDLLAAQAIKLIEWPERGAPRLPPPDLSLSLRVQGDGRHVEVQA